MVLSIRYLKLEYLLGVSGKLYNCYIYYPKKVILLSFSLDEKETKNQGKKMLPPAGLGWPAFLPTQCTLLMEYKFL